MLALVASDSEAQTVPIADSNESCSHAAITPISFTAPEAADQLIVQIIGNSCQDPVLAVTISTSENDVVYSHTFPALAASYDCGTVETCARSVFENATGPVDVFSNFGFPPLEDALEDDFYYDIEEGAYAYAQSEDRPTYCYQIGKSMEDCIVFMDGQAIRTHSSGT
jgi:hypothetical protein